MGTEPPKGFYDDDTGLRFRRNCVFGFQRRWETGCCVGGRYGDGILLLGNGNGTFQSFMTLGAGGFGIAAGDFNLDGKPDLAVGGLLSC